MMKQWRPGHLILGHADEVWHEVASSCALRENSQPMDEEIINRSTAKSSKATLIGTASSIEKSGNEVRREHNISIPETPLISNVENLFDDEDTWFIPSTCPPPRADEIDRWQHHIAFRQFGKDLRSAAAALFPNTATSRYKNVHVLMIRWEDEDPKLPVSEEIQKLERVFKNVYHFKTEVWCIPALDCHAEVNQKILDFKRVGGNCKDDLKIVYYAGHAKLAMNRLLSWTSWRCRKHIGPQIPTVKWSGIQNVLEEAESDVLLLLDCCHSGTANTNEGRGVTELISAGAFNTKVNGVGPYSFTNALILELEALASKRSFSTAELYNNIFCRIQLRIPEDNLKSELHPAPVHLVLTNDSQYRRSIHLSKLPISSEEQRERHQPPVHELHNFANGDSDTAFENGTLSPSLCMATNTDHIRDHSLRCSATVPRLALAIRFYENFQADECDTALLVEWLKSFPLVAEQVNIEAAFDSLSSLWIVSIPLSIYAYLKDHPAITCLGPITSRNKVVAVKEGPSEAVNSQTEIKSGVVVVGPSLNQDNMDIDRREERLMPPPFVLKSGRNPERTVMSFPPVPRISVPGHVSEPTGTGSRRRREEAENEDDLSESSTHVIKRQRLELPASSELSIPEPRPQLLRCIHNAIYPHTFSENAQTGDKYRECTGPGWKSMKQLKEHMKKVHTRQPRILNPLQCTRCQLIIADQKRLKAHEWNVDCPIRCPDCPEEFTTKSQRQLHQQENHPAAIAHPVFKELDDSTWKVFNDEIKQYKQTITSENGSPVTDPNTSRRGWVDANIVRFEAGRSTTRMNTRLELGQWCILATLLKPNLSFVLHPFYDDPSPATNPAEDDLLDRLLSTHETIVNAKVHSHGPPPFNLELQREWYQEALMDSIKTAARNGKSDDTARGDDKLGPSQGRHS